MIDPAIFPVLEWVAAGLGVANITLLIWRSPLNYPFGMAMVALYIFVFFEKRLYAESGLQVFFFAAQGWGWWMWRKTGAKRRRCPWAGWMAPAGWCGPPSRWRSAQSGLGAASLHQCGHALCRCRRGRGQRGSAGAAGAAPHRNWVLWVLIDVASIGLYINRGLYPTAGLYGGFLVMSLIGLREWARAAQGKTPAHDPVCFHGAESTGKSVLAERLRRRFGWPWVPEYGRAYAERHGTHFTMDDLLAMAEGQNAAMLAPVTRRPRCSSSTPTR
jgi:nicotinamide mononucleotide transporter